VRVEITLVCVVITFVRVEITLVSVIIIAYVSKSHSACRNHSCEFSYHIRACQIAIRVEITLCQYKSHSCVSYSYSYSHACVSKLLSYEWKPHSTCKITLCVLKSQSCVLESHFRRKQTLRVTILRVGETNLVRVEFTLLRVEITLYLNKSHS
jgi:hypothetical protein